MARCDDLAIPIGTSFQWKPASMKVLVATWLLPSLITYAFLVRYCDWFDFLPRRGEYAMFVPLALSWTLTAVMALCVLNHWRLEKRIMSRRRRLPATPEAGREDRVRPCQMADHQPDRLNRRNLSHFRIGAL
jgi:heme exporter protein D